MANLQLQTYIEEEHDPVPLRKTLVVVNNFIMTTTGFLNHFSTLCEDKIRKVSEHVDRVHISLSLLEAKLASVPGLDGINTTNISSSTSNTVKESDTAEESKTFSTLKVKQEQPTPSTSSMSSSTIQQPAPTPAVSQQLSFLKVKDDPTYATYFKMLRMKMPIGAIKNKLEMDGYDRSIIDNPDAPSSNYGGGDDVITSTTAQTEEELAPDPGLDIVPVAVESNVLKVKDDPQYATYFKMLKMRMPVGAVKNKLRLDGFDESVIDNPNAPSSQFE